MLAERAFYCFFFKLLPLHICLYNLRTVSLFFQCRNDFLLMLCTKALHRNTQLYCSASVNGNKLIVGQLDNVAVLFCNDGSYLAQFARLVRKQNGNREDTVS